MAAGIKVWMLTGDKVETAMVQIKNYNNKQCIAISTGIKKKL